MTSDTRAAFKAALKALLETVTGIKHVSLASKNIDQFTTDEYPLIRIDEGGGSASHYLTSAEVSIINFDLVLVVKVATNDDTLSGYIESVMDKMSNNPQVSNTCDLCTAVGQTPPEEWEDTGYKYRVLTYQTQLRRNF